MSSSSHSHSLHSDSDDDDRDLNDRPNPQSIKRTHYLSTIGLVQRPITDEQYTLPPLPPRRSSSPSLHNPPSSPPSTSERDCSIRFREDEVDLQDPLSKMEVAFARYLGIEREACPGSPNVKSRRSSHHSAQVKSSSTARSGRRPASEDLRSTRSGSQYALSSSRPWTVESSLPSPGNGFRAWFNGVSKHRSSISGLRSFSNPSSDNARPLVSGPIDSFNPNLEPPSPLTSGPSHTPTSPPLNPGGYVETRTWSSLMDPTTLSLYSEKEKNRQEAIFELINTEATFVENCQILSRVFYAELEPLIGSRASARIFSNIEDIMMFGTTFMSALEQRRVESMSHITRIGDIVMAYMLRVDVFRPYCSNQTNASRLLNDLKQKPAVSHRLSGLKVKGLELEHYLLQPMQRLTRYPLLIAQIMKYTDENSSDLERLAHALKKVQLVLVATNESIRHQEDHLKLLSLSEKLLLPGSDAKLSLATMTRFVGPRRLIREGAVSKSRSRKTLHAYLFSDFFLLTKPPTPSNFLDTNQSQKNRCEIMYRAPMALEQCQFLPGKDDHTFLVLHGSENFSLKVPEGSKTCKAWLVDLQNARIEVFKALAASKSKRATWATGRRRSESVEKPTGDSTRHPSNYNRHLDYDQIDHRGKHKPNDGSSIPPETSFSEFMTNSSSSILPFLNKNSIKMPM